MHDGWRVGRMKRTRMFAACVALLIAGTPAAAAALTDTKGAGRDAEKGSGHSAAAKHHKPGEHPTGAAGDQPSEGSPGAPPGHGTVLAGNPSATSLPTWPSTYDWSAGDGYVGWSVEATPGTTGYSSAQGLPGRPGLWLWPSGPMRMGAGQAGWHYLAPGTTRILSAAVQLQYDPRLLSHHCVDVTLRDAAGGERDGKLFCRPPLPPRGRGSLRIELGDPAANPTSVDLGIDLELPCRAQRAAIVKPGARSHSPRRRRTRRRHAVAASCARHIPPAHGTADRLRITRVDMVLVDDDQPVPAPAGPWFDLRDRYVDGKQAYGLTLAASDAGAGITSVAFEELGAGVLASVGAPCDPHHHTADLGGRTCPARYSSDTTVDTTQLAEGRHNYRETASDLAGNRGASDTWSVYVDRTPPSLASNFAAILDPATGDARASWNAGSDPVLRDGSPGSGLAGYSVRFRRGGADWSSWQSSADTGIDVPNSHVGEQIDLEVRSVDNVGNTSQAAAATVIVQANLTSDAGGPNVYAGGELAARNGDYVGAGRLDLLVGATGNDGDGVSQLSVQTQDGTTIAQANLDCTLGCPNAAEQTFSIDTRVLGEGAQTIWVAAVGGDQARTVEPATQVFVDRTPPGQPSNAVVTDYNPAARTATVDWTNGADPPLADGVPGAGRGRTLFRYQITGGWSAWEPVDGGEAAVGGLDAGAGFNIEVESVDKVGNQSPTLRAHLTADDTVPNSMLVQAGLLSPVSQAARVHRQRRARAHAAVNFTNCQPLLDDAYEQNAPPIFKDFLPVKTVVNARLQVYCHSVDSRFDRIEIRAGLAIKTGAGTDPSDFTKVTGLESPIVFNRPQHSLSLQYFNGPTFICAPGWGGTRQYVAYGEIKYVDDDGSDVTQNFDTGRGGSVLGITEPGPKPATCPTAPTRRLRELAGWKALLPFGPNDDPETDRPASSRSELRNSLGDAPYAEPGTKNAWDAHHVVPVSQPTADDLRELLFRCRIHPNAAGNGVYLRGSGLLKHKPAYADLVAYDRRHGTAYHKRAYHGNTFGRDYVAKLRSGYLADELRNNPETCSFSASAEVLASLRAAAGQLIASQFGVENPNH